MLIENMRKMFQGMRNIGTGHNSIGEEYGEYWPRIRKILVENMRKICRNMRNIGKWYEKYL